jgi:hypothetical protein
MLIFAPAHPEGWAERPPPRLPHRPPRTTSPSCDIRPVFAQIGQNETFVAE